MIQKLNITIFICFCFTSLHAFQTPIKITIHADEEKALISRHIYGHFAEHLGRCIYDGIYIGDNKEVDHINGHRKDIIEALKKLKVPNLRWPGGCFADTYHWMDGIGPKNKRPKIVNIWWGGETEDNSFGTHEFLEFCELINAEPYLAANVGSGTVRELMDWLDYLNNDKGSDMSELRKKNGRLIPYNVKMWGVGNEAWGCGGNMTADFYSNIYRQYATFMTDWSNSSKIYRIASGATDGDYSWTESLMKNIPHNMLSGVALHHYSVISWSDKGPAIGFTEKQYFKTMQEALKMDEFIKGHSTIMDKYDPDKKIGLIVDEWGGWYNTEKGDAALYQQNTMRDAVLAGVSLNIFNNHAERVKGANIAQMVNVLQSVILTNKKKMILTPTYHVMRMYNVHQDAKKLNYYMHQSPSYSYDKNELEALSISASKTPSGQINISIVNIDLHKSQKIALEIRGEDYTVFESEILKGKSIDDHNSFENPNKVIPTKLEILKEKNDTIELVLPPQSVVMIKGNK
ncbi:MAG: hypothetical protein RLZZ546_855 [Bacteroidota bacterium]